MHYGRLYEPRHRIMVTLRDSGVMETISENLDLAYAKIYGMALKALLEILVRA